MWVLFSIFPAPCNYAVDSQDIISYVTFIYVTYIIFIFGKNLMMHFEH